MRWRRLAWLPLAVVGCADGSGSLAPARPGSPAQAEAPEDAPDAAPRVTATAASEWTARRRLASQFRRAGYRILEDVTIEVGADSVTLDGYDPAKQVGYEYIAVEEREVDLQSATIRRLRTPGTFHILVLEATGGAGIDSAAVAFLESLAAADDAP